MKGITKMEEKRPRYYGIKRPDGTSPDGMNFADRCNFAKNLHAAIEGNVAIFADGNIHVTKGDIVTALRFILADMGA
jgi:hypothetical protein